MSSFTKTLSLFAVCFSSLAWAAETAAPEPKLYSSRYVIGSSAPTSNVNILQPEIGLVRHTGGEYVTISFLDSHLRQSQQTVGGVKITALSKSGRGAVLVHGVSLSPKDEPSELKSLEGMLEAGKSAEVTFPSPISEKDLVFQLEGYGDDDASVAIDVSFTESGTFKYRAVEDYVNPPEPSGSSSGGGGGDAGSYRDQCFSSPGHYGCDDRGPGSLYDQSGCEADPGSFNCQGG